MSKIKGYDTIRMASILLVPLKFSACVMRPSGFGKTLKCIKACSGIISDNKLLNPSWA